MIPKMFISKDSWEYWKTCQFNDENKSWCCILQLADASKLSIRDWDLNRSSSVKPLKISRKQTFKGWWKGISCSNVVHVRILYLSIYSFVVDLFHPLYKGYSVKSFHHLQAPWGDMISNAAQKGGETSPAIREMKDGWHGWQMRRCGQSITNP